MRAFLRGVVIATLLLLVTALAGTASAQTQKPPGELGALLDWIAARQESKCTERCFTLDRLKLSGTPTGTLGFQLEGSVLASHPVAIPLFGPPDKVRIESVEESGKPAAVGFESGHYYVMTASKRFVVKGSITLTKDLALDVTGPVNTLEADLTSGRVVEGARLAGIAGTTIHFDSGAGKASDQPTVFQLSRAVRVLREIGFEYRLVLRSGSDLGVVRLPLSYGEKVLEVSGSTGWKVEGTELVLPTAGKTASITVTGTLGNATQSFAPDARSPYEWWLLESDAEHRLTVAGDAKQLDAVESPIPKTQPTARLFLLERGKKMALSVQTLASVEALAAVVRAQQRLVVLTQQGDLVSDDTLFYENNGVDFLAYLAAGRPIFLATDGGAERILRRDDGSAVMIPLRKGTHGARVQSLSHVTLGALFGKLEVPQTDHALTESRATVTVGLPANVHPLVVLGGDSTQWLLPREAALAAVAALLVAWFAFASRRDRLLGALALFGLYVVSSMAFSLVVGGAVLFAGVRLAVRKLRDRPQATRWVLGLAGVGLVLAFVVTFASTADKSAPATEAAARPAPVNLPQTAGGKQGGEHANANLAEKGPEKPPVTDKGISGGTGDDDGKKKEDEKAKNGWKHDPSTPAFADINGEGRWRLEDQVLDGVAPVALSLPEFERSVVVSRELVTRDRPFRPVVLYVTQLALVVLGGVWLVVLSALVISQRARLLALRDRVHALLAPSSTPPAGSPTPAE